MYWTTKFKLTMENNNIAENSKSILVNRLNEGFKHDNYYRNAPSTKMANELEVAGNIITVPDETGYYLPNEAIEVYEELLKVLAEQIAESRFTCDIYSSSDYDDSDITISYDANLFKINSEYYPEGYNTFLCCEECGEIITTINEYDANKKYFCADCGEEIDLQEQYEKCKPIISEKVIVIK